jgi:hypothetical protein
VDDPIDSDREFVVQTFCEPLQGLDPVLDDRVPSLDSLLPIQLDTLCFSRW